MSNLDVTKEQLLSLINSHLRNHADFVEGMSFDDITLLPNGKFKVYGNFNFGSGNVSENYNSFNYIYNEVFSDFIA